MKKYSKKQIKEFEIMMYKYKPDKMRLYEDNERIAAIWNEAMKKKYGKDYEA